MESSSRTKQVVALGVFLATLLGMTLQLLLLGNFQARQFLEPSSKDSSSLSVVLVEDENVTSTTDRIVLPAGSTSPHHRKQEDVFFNLSQLDKRTDAYAAAWFQSKERFARNRVNKITYLEDAVWRAVDVNMGRDIRLTRDWLDFSVEHLSKWWRLVSVGNFDGGYWRLIINLLAYIRRESQSRQDDSSTMTATLENPFRDTIAVVAYHPVNAGDPRMQIIDIVVLAAQMASLIRCHTGRIVVFTDFGQLNYTETHVWPFAMELLQQDDVASQALSNATIWTDQVQQERIRPRIPLSEVMIGTTEVALVGIDATYKSLQKKTKNLVPRSALIALHDALFKKSITVQQRRFILGTGGPDCWNYVYYTEQDSPLYTRAQAWPDFKAALDKGAILTPHRLLSVPHANDFIGVPKDVPQTQYIPAVHNWTTLVTLDEEASCCDLGRESRYAMLNYPSKGNFWYLKGFGRPHLTANTPQEINDEMARRLERFSTYKVMQLERGTGLSFAGCENARQCAPGEQTQGCTYHPEK